MQTRSKSGIVKPKQFQDYQGYFTCLTASVELDEPCSYKVASYSAEWRKAMQEEIDALQSQGTWSLEPNPGNKNIVGSKWLYKIKKNSDGSIARQLDVKNAFLHGELEEEVFMRQPQGYEDPAHLEYVLFEMKDMGRLAYFLGLQIAYPVSGGLFVSQTKYAKDLLHKAGMHSCRACSTPCKPHNQILTDIGEPLSDPTMFRSVVGALQYLTFTRPDLAYAVNTVCQYMNSPTDVH
ncbi:unnamed protein product [Prunus brigantina]